MMFVALFGKRGARHFVSGALFIPAEPAVTYGLSDRGETRNLSHFQCHFPLYLTSSACHYSHGLVAAARCLTSATIAMNRGSLCSDVRSGSFSISSASDGFSPVSSACRKSDSAFGRFPLR